MPSLPVEMNAGSGIDGRSGNGICRDGVLFLPAAPSAKIWATESLLLPGLIYAPLYYLWSMHST